MRLEWLELRVPPLIVTALASAAVLASGSLPPATSLDSARVLIGAAIAVAGIGFSLVGVANFRRARTTVDPLHPDRSERLVTDGVYRLSRNPMYVGFVTLLLGLAVALASAVGVALSLATAAYLDRFQIRPEERMLRQRFGSDFQRYSQAVRRWL